MSAENLERQTHKVKFSDALSRIERELAKALEADGEARITTPFESSILKNSITEENLKQYTALKIECILYHTDAGDLVISTGAPSTTAYDFGREIDSLRHAREIRMRLYGDLTADDAIEFAPLRGVSAANKLKVKHMRTRQPFIAHHHPSGILAISSGDIFASADSKSDIDMVLTKDGVVFYKADPDQANRLRLWAQLNQNVSGTEHQKLFQKFIEEEGLIKKTVMFDTPEMQGVVAFMRGEKSWSDIQ